MPFWVFTLKSFPAEGYTWTFILGNKYPILIMTIFQSIKLQGIKLQVELLQLWSEVAETQPLVR